MTMKGIDMKSWTKMSRVVFVAILSGGFKNHSAGELGTLIEQGEYYEYA